MNKRQIEHENMYSAVLAIFAEYGIVIANNQPILDGITVMQNNMTGIDTYAQIQQETTKGATIEEYNARLDATNKGEKIILGIKPYYLLNNDTTNLAMVSKTYSDFMYKSRTNSLHLMQLINTKALAIPIADLNPFGITAQDRTDYGTSITTFENSMPKNRTILSSMKTATSELKTIFANQKIEIDKMDILMGPFKLINKEFWQRYTNARILVNIGAGQTAEIAILDALGFVPIFGNKMKPGYTVTFRNRNPFPVKIALSNDPQHYSPEFEVTIDANADRKLHIPDDFGSVLGNYMMVLNPNKYNKIKVTAILAKGPSRSSAPELTGSIKG